MIRFVYCMFEKGLAVNHGDETLIIYDGERGSKPIEKIIGALKSESQFVPQPVEHVTELEVNRVTKIDGDVIRGWLSEKPTLIWDEGPILLSPGDTVEGTPGWFETEGLDQLFPLLKEILTSALYARPWLVYQNYVGDDTIQWAKEENLQILKVEQLFPKRSIYYPTESFLQRSIS